MHEQDERGDEQPDDAGEDDGYALQPGDPDYDLSEQHGYTWEPGRPGWPPQWLILAVTALVVAALIVPTVLIILSRG